MDQDDPEQRIAELERQVEEAKRAAGRPPSTNGPGPPPLPNAPGLRMIIAVIGAVVIAASIGLVYHLTQPSQSGPASGPASGLPSIPTSVHNPTTDAEPTVLPPGGVVEFNVTSEVSDESVVCNDANVTVTGKGRGTSLTLTGHCARLEINSMGGHVTVDSVDEINVEGMDNVVTYHSGAPRVNRQGVNNSVEQG